jgi:hypothetical protein
MLLGLSVHRVGIVKVILVAHFLIFVMPVSLTAARCCLRLRVLPHILSVGALLLVRVRSVINRRMSCPRVGVSLQRNGCAAPQGHLGLSPLGIACRQRLGRVALLIFMQIDAKLISFSDESGGEIAR